MKKILVLVAMSFFGLYACGAQADAKSDGANDSKLMDNSEGVVFTGIFKEGDFSSDEHIMLTDFETEEDSPIKGEVVLLVSEDTRMVFKETGEEASVSDLEVGDKVEVLLIKDAPMTMSLPPQIPGRAILEVRVPE